MRSVLVMVSPPVVPDEEVVAVKYTADKLIRVTSVCCLAAKLQMCAFYSTIVENEKATVCPDHISFFFG